MQLDRLSMVVRPRNAWESIDMGFLLVRQYWQPLFKLWFTVLLPVAAALYGVSLLLPLPWFWWTPMIWWALLLWWLKPLYDRILLFFLSRAVFGEYPGLREIWRALPFLLFKTGLGFNLTFGRIQLSRSFVLPVWQLEGLRGEKGRRRLRLLQLRAQTQAVWLTIVCVHLEWLLYLSLLALLYLLIPQSYAPDFGEMFMSSEPQEISQIFSILQALLSTFALGVMEPFYVAGGFALYLNRRTQLEGWDIELTFRRLNQRLRNGVTMLMALGLALLLLVSVPPSAQAAERAPPETAKAHISEILQDSDFDTGRGVILWRSLQEDEKKADGWNWDWEWLRGFFDLVGLLIEIIAQSLELIIWLVVGIAVAVWLYYGLRYLGWGTPSTSAKRSQADKTAAPRLFEAEPELLSGDVAAQAWRLWERKQYLESLSLLYRGALQALHLHHRVPLAEGATEGECLSLVRRAALPAELHGYFAKLTRTWQYAAYAERLPDSEVARELCEGWPRHFGEDLSR